MASVQGRTGGTPGMGMTPRRLSAGFRSVTTIKRTTLTVTIVHSQDQLRMETAPANPPATAASADHYLYGRRSNATVMKISATSSVSAIAVGTWW